MSVYVEKLVKQAREAAYKINKLEAKVKNRALRQMAKMILAKQEYILKQNRKDLCRAEKDKVSKSFIDRLTLTPRRIYDMSLSLGQIAAFSDPVDAVICKWRRPNGMVISKVRSPLGVVLIIYEARPNVTSDCAGLLFKSSNVGILRGGKSALCSNLAIADTLNEALHQEGLDFNPFFMVKNTDYKVVDELLTCDRYIDLVIPRGGEKLIRKVAEASRIPVIKHYKGVCHIFVDQSAELKKAVKICVNAKTQRPAVCNAVETILVHRKIAAGFLPRLGRALGDLGVQIRACPRARKFLPGARAARNTDWTEEYLDLIVAIRVVDDLDQAIKHINTYGSGHTDSILTRSKERAGKFTHEVDSACCFVNISTRFSDGQQFGLGAEIGISTDKLHARGPMGVEDLTTYKYIVTGCGQIRE